jgi:hypothetical protein
MYLPLTKEMVRVRGRGDLFFVLRGVLRQGNSRPDRGVTHKVLCGVLFDDLFATFEEKEAAGGVTFPALW